ncbi:MAG TPA: MFS transporter, partial [Patescibacteria group bacterium]|nr:MFS transporter [Patescibacteria group bacterium]
EPLFWGPILITFISRVSGMSLSQIYVMESICVVGLFLLEIPSGALADLIGRRKTILIGSCLLFCDIMVFASAINPAMIWIANLIWVCGFSLISGADSALLYDTLKVLGRESEFKKIEGRAISYRLFLLAGCAITVGYLASINIRLPVYLSAGFKLLFVVVIYFFIEPPMTRQGRYNWREHLGLMKISILFVANHKNIKWIISFVVIIGVASKIWFFSYNPYFELVDLPLIYFGWLFCGLNIIAAISSFFSDWIARKIGDLGSIILILAVIGIPILLMGSYVAKIMVLLVLMQNIARGHLTPFIGHFLNQYLDSENRATVISIKSAVVSLGQFVMLGLFGWSLKLYNLPSCLQILGVFTLALSLVLIVSYWRIFGRK